MLQYDDLRNLKLKNVLFPARVMALAKVAKESNINDILKSLKGKRGGK